MSSALEKLQFEEYANQYRQFSYCLEVYICKQFDVYERWNNYHNKVKIAGFVVILPPKIFLWTTFNINAFWFSWKIYRHLPKNSSKYDLLFSCVVLFVCSFLHQYNACTPIILIWLINSFTDYWSNINVTESVERYRSMSATYWSRWLLLVCTSKYYYN